MNPQTIGLTLTLDAMRVIETALIERPYKEVAGVMAELAKQYADAMARAKAIADAKASLPPIANAA